MKKNILKAIIFSFALCITIVSEAQIEKGMKVLTGSLSFSTNTANRFDTLSNLTNKSSRIEFNPSIGFLVSDKICIGINVPLDYSFGTNKTTQNYSTFDLNQSRENNSFGYGIAPYVRYYIKITDKFYGYLNGSVRFGLRNSYTKTETTETYPLNPLSNNYSNVESKYMYYDYSARVNFGLMYFISNKLALEASLASIGYGGNGYKNKDKSYNYEKQSGFYTSLAPSNINLGLSYYFR